MTRAPVLVTGSSGLIGRALMARLGGEARGLDLRGEGAEHGDVRDPDTMARAIAGCRGVVHLAAVSRVIDAERDPARCESINIGGVETVIAAARAAGAWLLFASSREVYGQAASLPVAEDAPRAPLNVYGRAKVRGEDLVTAAGGAIVRLSSVYGDVRDHADRVVPAFARAASRGEPLRIDGAAHTFDFVHLSDAVSGIAALIARLDRGAVPPPVHLVSGRGTSLGDLASMAIDLGGAGSTVTLAPPRDYDVARFVGDPARARALLGWTAQVPIERGLALLVSEFHRWRPAAG